MLFTCVMFIVHFSFPNFFFSGGVGGGGETKKRVHGLGPKWGYMDLGSVMYVNAMPVLGMTGN